MAVISPFRGLRYDPSITADLGRLVCPPYDVMGHEEVERYHALDEHNCIRLESPLSGYAQAAEDLSRWLGSGALVRDPEPAFYLYRQEFSFRNQRFLRTAVLAAVRVGPYGKGRVVPHEQVRPKPIEDRLALLRATGVMPSPVFAVYRDPRHEASREIELAASATDRANLRRFEDAGGVVHELAPIFERGFIGRFAQLLTESSLLIADGHHRYETARRFFFGQDVGWALMALVSASDPGLVLLPTHRLVEFPGGPGSDGSSLASLVENEHGRESLRMEPIKGEGLDLGDWPELRVYIRPDLSSRPSFYRVTGRFQELMKKNAPGETEASRRVPVSILHRLILDRLPSASLSYTHDEGEALTWVDREPFRAAFFAPAPRLDEVMEIAESGVLMPAKSTYFHPKFPAGIVLYEMASGPEGVTL